MKKILQVNKFYYPYIGGIETVAKYLAENFNDEKKWQTEVLVCQEKGSRKIEFINKVKVTRASTLGVFLRMPISFDFFWLFREKTKEADIVVIHHPFPLAFLAYVLFSKKPLIVWYHSDIVKQKITGKLISPIINRVLGLAEIILVSNQAIIKNSKSLKRFQRKCETIPYGLEIGHLLVKRQEKEIDFIRKEFGQGRPLVLSVGRLIYYKGFEYLIEAFSNIDNINLLIIGDGPLRNKLDNLIIKNNLQDRVTIISSVSDLVPYYQASDLFVLPSVAESEVFGLVQIEALAAGLPVINTSLPTGVPEVSLDKETGITVEPRDSKALSEAIKKIIKNHDLKMSFSLNARKRAKEYFSLKRFISSNEKYFIKLLENN